MRSIIDGRTGESDNKKVCLIPHDEIADLD